MAANPSCYPVAHTVPKTKGYVSSTARVAVVVVEFASFHSHSPCHPTTHSYQALVDMDTVLYVGLTCGYSRPKWEGSGCCYANGASKHRAVVSAP